MQILEAEKTVKVIQDKFNAGELEPVQALQEMEKVYDTLLVGLGGKTVKEWREQQETYGHEEVEEPPVGWRA